MDTSPTRFMSYDVDLSRSAFASFNEEYFKSVFFDFAPLLAVPAYQDEPVPSMRPPKVYESAYTSYEHELLANAIGRSVFAHPASHTDAILKTSVLESRDGVDRLRVTAYSYRTEPRTDFVPVMGGDGRMHAVPVLWDEYIPIQCATDMAVGKVEGDTQSVREKKHRYPFPQNAALRHGLMAYIPAVGDSTDKIVSFYKQYM